MFLLHSHSYVSNIFMLVYSINDLEVLSGVKAHTIRMWEKRYGIIKPKRTETNIRYYHDSDLQLVINISFLNRNGFKISKISEMTEDEIKARVAKISNIENETEEKLTAMSLAMLELDEFKFTKYLNHYIEKKGLEETMVSLVYPFLDKMADLWHEHKIKSVHESFVTQIIKRKIMVEINHLDHVNCQKKKILIYLADKENQELSFNYIHYLLRKNGVNVVNIGNNISLIEILETNQLTNFAAILTFLNPMNKPEQNLKYLKELSKTMFGKRIFIMGAVTEISHKLSEYNNLSFLNSIEDLNRAISIL